MATTNTMGRVDKRTTVTTKRNWLHTLIATTDSLPLMITRVLLGLVMLPHGMQKLFGMFGGFGFSGTMGFFTGQLGLPWVLGFLVIMAESFGSLLLIFGFATRFAAFGIFCVMLGAALMAHWQFGFFMNWSGQQGGEGFEFHILAMAMAATLMVGGAGKASIDWMLYRRNARPVRNGPTRNW